MTPQWREAAKRKGAFAVSLHDLLSKNTLLSIGWFDSTVLSSPRPLRFGKIDNVSPLVLLKKSLWCLHAL
jgi:hypothetical protein